jgi:hypothetical protein
MLRSELRNKGGNMYTPKQYSDLERDVLLAVGYFSESLRSASFNDLDKYEKLSQYSRDHIRGCVKHLIANGELLGSLTKSFWLP